MSFRIEVQPVAVIVFAAILVSLTAVFLFLGKEFLSNDRSLEGANKKDTGLAQPFTTAAAAILLIGVFVASLFLGREFLFAENSDTAVSSQARNQAQTELSQEELEDLATSVDQSADEIYSGLDTTKRIIGKTEARQEAIEQGRDHASDKLKSLSERIRKAADGGEPLQLRDRQQAEHITEGLN